MTEKKKAGRPRKKLNDEQIAQVEALAAYLSIEQISAYLGMSKVTFYEIMKRQPIISERYKRGKAKAIVSISQGLIREAQAGNTTAAMFYLKTQAGWREKEKEDVPEENNLNIKIEIEDAKKSQG